jgi:hypothetical protein
LTALSLALGALASLPQAHAAAAAAVVPQSAAAAHPTRAYWNDIKGTPAAKSRNGAEVAIKALKFRATTLDRASIAAMAAAAPSETNLRAAPLVISLPDPDGGFQRFTLVDSPVMEAGLAAKHPELRTYAGKGIDDPSANIRISITPLGFQASVRSSKGSWYIDPYYRLDESLYASYYRRSVPKSVNFTEAMLSEPIVTVNRGKYRAADKVQVRASGFTPGGLVAVTVKGSGDALPRQTLHATANRDGSVSVDLTADPYKNLGRYAVTLSDGKATADTGYEVVADGASTDASSGPTLKTYRVALITDPSYATYSGGSAFVTAAKVALMNRVTQMYEYDTAIRLVLINDTDKLNLDTAALATGANGPCGATACYTAATLASCGSGQGLARNRIVAGMIVGASNYDIGHLGLGVNGGGVANLGVVGGANKAGGCTGIPTPVGDFYAIDYVAHEMGHQFAGNHTFNGTISNCSTSNRNAGTSVEPGSGSSIMAYAGICGNDNLQPHSDPYWSFRSFEEITTYTSGAETNLAEVQMGVLGGYTTNGASYKFSYNGALSADIVRGTNNTAAGIKAAIEAIPGWPAAATVTASSISDTGFTLTFASAAGDVPNLVAVPGDGVSALIGELTKGGLTTKQGIVQTATGNSAPIVTVPAASYTIPIRTPFALTGSATDVDGDTITYMWEQTDRGATGTSNGTSLVANNKANGPLFRQFGTRAVVSSTDTLLYDSPGENKVTTNPLRVFPDMAQILINNTNAESGSCTMAGSAPTAAEIDCFSEYLPTATYVGTSGVNASPASLNFRLTARDGKGGVNNATVQLILASGAGPFLVTSPNTAVTLPGATSTNVTWSVAGTDAAPVSTSNVKITLSVDGGLTFPYTLSASTANSGSAAVTMPNVATTQARVKVEALGNVFFDVSNADFTIALTGDVDGNGAVDCTDLAIVKAAMGKRVGQPGYDARADVNNDGVIDIRDLTYVSQRVTTNVRCGA